MDKIINTSSAPPTFFGAVILEFTANKTETEIMEILGNSIIFEHYNDMTEVTYLSISNCSFWEMDDMLSYLFARCDLEQLKEARDFLCAKIWICISFYHKDRFPALVIDSENMGIIRDLQACISIDAY